MNINTKKLEFIFNLRSAGVTDTKVLNIMEHIPRSRFVGDNFKIHALDDVALPTNYGQTITQPSVVGIMTQALKVTSRCKVLEVGTGTGYQTAILSNLARRVYSLEIIKGMVLSAQERIDALKIRNATILVKDGSDGLIEQAPFDRIILTAATEDVSPILLKQLKTDGILVAPVGMSEKFQKIIKVEKTKFGYDYSDLKSVRFLPLTDIKSKDLHYNHML
tara:strand:+ start:17 stop:676 length:660 start_codon:yes stop_codon:yes gene_type:complete